MVKKNFLLRILIVLVLVVVATGLILGHNNKVRTSLVGVSWEVVSDGVWNLVIDAGDRRVTAVKLGGEGGVISLKTNTRNGLVAELENKIEGSKWNWGVVLMGPTEKLAIGKQVWATADIKGQRPKISGIVVLAEDNNKPAEQVKIGAGI